MIYRFGYFMEENYPCNSFVLIIDHWSKKIYRPKMIVDIRCSIHLRWSCLYYLYLYLYLYCSWFVRVIVRSWCSCYISFQFETNCPRFVSKWKSNSHSYFVLLLYDFDLFSTKKKLFQHPIVWILLHPAELMLLLHLRQISNLSRILLQKETSICIFVSYCRFIDSTNACKPISISGMSRYVQNDYLTTHPSPLCPRWMKYHIFLNITYPEMGVSLIVSKTNKKVFPSSNNLNIIPQEVLQKAVFTKAGRSIPQYRSYAQQCPPRDSLSEWAGEHYHVNWIFNNERDGYYTSDRNTRNVHNIVQQK